MKDLINRYRYEVEHKKAIAHYPQAVTQVYVGYLELEKMLNFIEDILNYCEREPEVLDCSDCFTPLSDIMEKYDG